MENNILYRRNNYNGNFPNGRLNGYGTFSEQVTPTAPVKDWCGIKQQIAYILGQAELDWYEVYDPKYPNGRFIKENELEKDLNGREIKGKYRMTEVLEDYWKAVRGTSKNPPGYQAVNPAAAAIASSTDKAWSAAFVSWVMRTSGVEESDGFAFSARHLTYIVQALSNARRNDSTKPFWLKDVATSVEVGDILCFNRANDNGVMTNYKLNELARTYLDSNNNVKNLENVGGVSHCDVVKEIISRDGRKFAYAVGGNKGIKGAGKRGWTVNNVEIELDANNVIINPGRCFGVIKVGTSCATDAPSTSTRESYQESLSESQNQISASVGLNATNNRNDVIIIQNLLKNLGYPLQNNGLISNAPTDATILSIFNFQTNTNLRITGNISPNDTALNLLNQRNSNLGNVTESDDESVHQPFFTNAFTFRRNANNANTLNVFFEGDSWLDYPIPSVLDLYDTITDRNQRLNLNSLHLAKFGETTADMFSDRADFEQYITNYRIDRIYFSGGGNDVFPNLGRIVRPGTTFDASFFTDPQKYYELRSTPVGDELNRKCVQFKNNLNTTAFDAAFFNTTSLNSIFSIIKDNYLRFGNIINAHSTPNLIFYMHSYDYPMYKLGVRPTLGVSLPIGPWVKPALDSLGITDPILINYIIIRLLDKFYALLCHIQSQFMALGFHFQSRIIDFRGLLNSSEYWRDEIHPNSAGASRLATRVNF